MKPYLIITCLLIIVGCSKKTHLASSFDATANVQYSADSSADKKLLVIDRSKSFTTKFIDTNINISGSTFSGYLTAPKLNNDTSARFDNEDMAVILRIDKLGVARFTAEIKDRKIPVSMLERTETYNDVVTNEDTRINNKTSSEAIATLKEKQSEKQTGPSANLQLIIIFAVLLAIMMVYVMRKLSLFKISL